MSVLEIILYSLLGVGFTIWLIVTLVNFKKKKNGTYKKKNDEDED